MPWSRYTNQPTLTYSNLTGFYGTVVYKAWDIDRQDIVISPETLQRNPGGTNPGDTEGLPAYDTPWPFGSSVDPGVPIDQILLDDYSVSKNGSELIVVALYTDRRSRNVFATSFQTKQDGVEYQVKYPIILNKSQGAGTDTQWKWVDFTSPVFSTIQRVAVTRHIKVEYTPGETGPPMYLKAFSKIREQNNKLHYFGSDQNQTTIANWYRFEGADIQQIGWDRFKVSYSWVGDSGNLADYSAIFIPGGGDNNDPSTALFTLNFPRLPSQLETHGGAFTETDRKWFRAPFEQTVAIPPKEYFERAGDGLQFDPTKPPPNTYISRMIFKMDATGWSSLPGFDGVTSPLP